MAPHPIPLPCALDLLSPRHRDATTPSPCWAPHFVTQERIMFSNPTPSKQRLTPAATMSDDTLSAPTPPMHCASILQPATPPQVVTFEFWTIPRRPMYLLIVGSHYCVKHLVYALHMRRQNLVLFPCLYIEPSGFELVTEIIFHYCTTPPCHKINRFKRPFRGSCCQRLDDAFVLLVCLIFLDPQKILISVR